LVAIEKDKESLESSGEEAEELDEVAEESGGEVEETEVRTKQFPANKYELAIVAAQEARRMNEGWKDQEGEPVTRVTDVALDRVKKGDVRYTFGEVEKGD
jgi:DNA-directed RNA polymerase subunit K/omega